jgi:hypothetical protein
MRICHANQFKQARNTAGLLRMKECSMNADNLTMLTSVDREHLFLGRVLRLVFGLRSLNVVEDEVERT